MKAGIAAALFAVEGIRRAGVELNGAVEISGTVDEESGGFAGVAWLAEHGRLSAVRTDYVIIPSRCTWTVFASVTGASTGSKC